MEIEQYSNGQWQEIYRSKVITVHVQYGGSGSSMLRLISNIQSLVRNRIRMRQALRFASNRTQGNLTRRRIAIPQFGGIFVTQLFAPAS